MSYIENGKPVNSGILFKVREHFRLLDDLHDLIEQKHTAQHNSLARKSRKGIPELDNNF
ncbi:MAG: transcriptional regulator [Alteromonadaceae bacterium]|nr:transcriptional regulator [Alteromonadaceae bacterium]MAX43597.1 transcriptional regulator [Alteromonadaceae bacterium]